MFKMHLKLGVGWDGILTWICIFFGLTILRYERYYVYGTIFQVYIVLHTRGGVGLDVIIDYKYI